MMFEFQYPYMFLLALLPFVIYFFTPATDNERHGIPTIFNPNLKWFTRAFGQGSMANNAITEFNIYLYIIWLLIVLSLMHPQRIEQLANKITKGYDIMLAVDLSDSMRALDFADLNHNDYRNRLDVLKDVAGKFIANRTNDRIGLILFGTSAYLQTPLTTDTSSVITMLDLSDIGMAGDRTAIGDAIALGVKALIQRPEGSRIMILMTDGSSNSDSVQPIEAARLAKAYGIKIYCIGVGQKGAVPYPSELGILYARIDMDETTLKKIAEETGGSYFSATDEESLKEIYRKIDALEKTSAESPQTIVRHQLYRIPLIIAMGMLLFMIGRRYNWQKVFE